MSKKQKTHQMITPGNALGVKVVDKDIALALKLFKRKIKTSGIMNQLKDLTEYTKPGVIKRAQRNRASYAQRMKSIQS
jgi:ribosomal protein S21